MKAMKEAYTLALLAVVRAYAKQFNMSKRRAAQQAVGLLKKAVKEASDGYCRSDRH